MAVAPEQLPRDARDPLSWVKLASPGPRNPMTAKVERLARPLRVVVERIADDLPVEAADFRALYAPRASWLGFRSTHGDISRRAAWALAAQWLVAYATGAITGAASLADAEAWFVAHHDLPRSAPEGVDMDEAIVRAGPDEVFALLPYLLDPLAPGTRRDVLKDGSSLPDRLARKSNGVYYTPADLAQHMAGMVASTMATTCIDPACGSGVFLRAAAAELRRRVGLFGCDIDPLAAEMCAFVLLATQRRGASTDRSPWSQWHEQRLRLATVDSLLLRPGTDLSDLERAARDRERSRVRRMLSQGRTPVAADDGEPEMFLGSLFPELAGGADVLLCNPPYAALSDHPARHELGELFSCFADATPTSATNTYLPFVEHAWRLTHDDGCASVVVPLSIAYGSHRHMRALRRAMFAREGRWRFSFFDRSPDGLFGDDVKTRNAVLHYSAKEPRGIETTDLLRWTSRMRERLFSTVPYVEVASSDLEDAIPKIASEHHAEFYRAIRELPGTLGDSARSIGRVSARCAADRVSTNSVYVGGTAYNWLNCVRNWHSFIDKLNLSDNPMTALTFATKTIADGAYAVLASRIVVWLWRIEGDGFHVSRQFLANVPFDLLSLDSGSLSELARAGTDLWDAVQSEAVVSINKGRRTVGFPPYRAGAQLDAVDDVLLNVFGVRQYVDRSDISDWYEQLLVVDASDERRGAMVPVTTN